LNIPFRLVEFENETNTRMPVESIIPLSLKETQSPDAAYCLEASSDGTDDTAFYVLVLHQQYAPFSLSIKACTRGTMSSS